METYDLLPEDLDPSQRDESTRPSGLVLVAVVVCGGTIGLGTGWGGRVVLVGSEGGRGVSGGGGSGRGGGGLFVLLLGLVRGGGGFTRVGRDRRYRWGGGGRHGWMAGRQG